MDSKEFVVLQSNDSTSVEYMTKRNCIGTNKLIKDMLHEQKDGNEQTVINANKVTLVCNATHKPMLG